MSKKNNLVINTFPRSGTVFFTECFSEPEIVNMDLSAVHLPLIFDSKQFYQTTIVREPISAIASNLYLNRMNIDQSFGHEIKMNVELYVLFASMIEENKDNEKLHIIQFERGTTAPLDELRLALEKWNLPFNNPRGVTNEELIKKVREKFAAKELLGDRGGHMPREKTSDRIRIEKIVKEDKHIEDALRWYDKIKVL